MLLGVVKCRLGAAAAAAIAPPRLPTHKCLVGFQQADSGFSGITWCKAPRPRGSGTAAAADASGQERALHRRGGWRKCPISEASSSCPTGSTRGQRRQQQQQQQQQPPSACMPTYWPQMTPQTLPTRPPQPPNVSNSPMNPMLRASTNRPFRYPMSTTSCTSSAVNIPTAAAEQQHGAE